MAILKKKKLKETMISWLLRNVNGQKKKKKEKTG